MARAANPNDPEFMQSQADANGISLAEISRSCFAGTPSVYQANVPNAQYGAGTGGAYGQNPGLTNALQILKLAKLAGQGQGQTQSAAASASPRTNFGQSSSGSNSGGSSQQGNSYYGNSSMAQNGITEFGKGDGYRILQNTGGKRLGVDSAGNYFDIDASGKHIAVSDKDAVAAGFQSAHPQDAFGNKKIGTGQGYSIVQNSQGQNLGVDSAGNYFNIDAAGKHIPVSDQDAQKMGFQSANPETNALKQMGQVDPQSEALRTSLGKSYADTLAQAQNPQAKDYQSYLNLFKQTDPEEYAQRQGMATSMDKFLASQQADYALGSQLDPVSQMQVEQQARAGQAARGNLYGSGQAAVEAMTTGQAGQALKQQRMTNLQQALGGQQSYLGSGLGLGSTAMQLYQQGLANKSQAQQAGLSYLSSGQTPYQAGASYVSNAEGTAGNAAQGGPQYNPSSLGTSYSGSAQSAPQYGLDVGSQSQNYFNSLNNSYGGGGGGSTKNRAVSAGTGALSGAMAGATAGSVVPGYGTAIGAVVGAAAGGLSGYYSAPDRG